MSTPWIVAFSALAAVVLLLVVVVVGVLRRALAVLEHAEAHAAAAATPAFQAPSRGQRVQSFELTDASGRVVSSEELLRSPAVYLFLSADCEPCRRLAPELVSGGVLADGVPLRVIVDRAHEDEPFPLPAFARVFRQDDGSASRAFGSSLAPHAIAVDADGFVVAAEVAQSSGDLRRVAEALQAGGEPERELALL